MSVIVLGGKVSKKILYVQSFNKLHKPLNAFLAVYPMNYEVRHTIAYSHDLFGWEWYEYSTDLSIEFVNVPIAGVVQEITDDYDLIWIEVPIDLKYPELTPMIRRIAEFSQTKPVVVADGDGCYWLHKLFEYHGFNMKNLILATTEESLSHTKDHKYHYVPYIWYVKDPYERLPIEADVVAVSWASKNPGWKLVKRLGFKVIYGSTSGVDKPPEWVLDNIISDKKPYIGPHVPTHITDLTRGRYHIATSNWVGRLHRVTHRPWEAWYAKLPFFYLPGILEDWLPRDGMVYHPDPSPVPPEKFDPYVEWAYEKMKEFLTYVHDRMEG
jgi:hypothetical protein